ncbi:hypothetical protein BDY19DRAFT_1018610 [Irpex rosettiformis]|uniref:Uncharacterized protein n=1 Tax=Irpex rosettiformis TaxID=378272 RepID=A0ACB8TUZ6_9APHY|nr:hypothetical protein BDY19DRAFT_1018610 [Irpex rosettiformis]
MEHKFSVSDPTFRAASPQTSTIPQKRKSAQEDRPPRSRTTPSSPADSRASEESPHNEYQTGRVTCEHCGTTVSFRDDVTGKFTVKHWDSHRQDPSASHPITVTDPVMYTPETRGEPSVPQIKRRRAKRTEEERIDYLRSDPYVAQFEAYRVLCASCDKWIRLRPNSTYCSIPWDAHRKSCLSKKAAKVTASDERSNLFSTDPQVREFESQRVRCKICDSWVSVAGEDNAQALQTWLAHRSRCLSSRRTPTSGVVHPSASTSKAASIPSVNSVPPPSKHLLAMVSSSTLPTPQIRPSVSRNTTERSTPSTSTFSPTFKDLTPSNFIPSQESRRRNAEQRAANLRSDPYVSQVEPNRVFCSVCKKWVQLRQDSSYCAYPWTQHKDKCLKRQQRRAQKAADLAQYRAQMEALDQEERSVKHAEHSDGLESEASYESGDDETRERRLAEKRDNRRRMKLQAEADRARFLEERKALLLEKEAALLHYSDEDAEGESDDAEDEALVVHFAELDTPIGRLEFVSTSIRYLFRTTYEHSDDLTIAALVTYLNAAIPPDKHEDFDTTEVTKAAMALRERGEFVFQGDTLRLP